MPRLAVFAIAGLFVAGCGGSDNASDSTASAPTPTVSTLPAKASGATKLAIHMSEFSFDPKDVTAKAGKVVISAPNDGKNAHELVLLKTDADPAHLKKVEGEVDESSSVGEISDVAPGQTKSKVFTLAPGKYAMVCNLPGHYASGMYGSLTVK